MAKYELANFLHEYSVEDKSFKDKYAKWLDSQASRHFTRDKEYFDKHNDKFEHMSRMKYKEAIHQAVNDSNGKDYYTGKQLEWDRILTWNNSDSKKKGYKSDFKGLPTVDHIDRGNFHEEINFVICSWSVNDAKNDLSEEEFLQLCESVVEHSKSKKTLNE